MNATQNVEVSPKITSEWDLYRVIEKYRVEAVRFVVTQFAF